MSNTSIKISCDDGCASDIRLARLCNKHEIECVFYWPVEWHSLALFKGYEPLRYVQAEDIAMKFEIGAHTITHRHLTDLRHSEALYEIAESKLMLENMFAPRTITKFAPPRGYTNKELTEYTLQIYGSQRLTKQPNLVHVHPNSGANDNKPWQECITDKTTELFCHSHELDKFNLWDELEAYLETTK